jgi:hypothetical protein
MTDKQRKLFYFPAWHRCCAANNWVEVKGRMAEDARRTDPDAPEMAVIWTMATQAAEARHSAVTVDDLRHACHALALGKDKSCTDLTNPEVQRVVDLFEYLAAPDNLDMCMKWQDPRLSQKRSLISYIKRRAPEQYICAIARDRWDTIFWEDRSIEELRWLSAQLAHRSNTWRRPVPITPRAHADAGQPW